MNGIHEVGSSILPGSTIFIEALRYLEIPGWQELEQQLTRQIQFKDFSQAFAFISRVALIAEVQQHHPDWSNSYGLVTIRLSTHDQKDQITQKDYDLALAINEILEG